MDQDFGRAVTRREEQNLPGAYLHFSRDLKVASLERKKKRKTAVEESNPSACCLLLPPIEGPAVTLQTTKKKHLQIVRQK